MQIGDSAPLGAGAGFGEEQGSLGSKSAMGATMTCFGSETRTSVLVLGRRGAVSGLLQSPSSSAALSVRLRVLVQLLAERQSTRGREQQPRLSGRHDPGPDVDASRSVPSRLGSRWDPSTPTWDVRADHWPRDSRAATLLASSSQAGACERQRRLPVTGS
jgi:hypothetical protein